MITRKTARETLTAAELDCGDALEFTLADGSMRTLALVATGAEVIRTTLETLRVETPRAVTDIRFWCEIAVDGEPHKLEREISTQASFYEPWDIAGMRIWFDAVDDIFEFLLETHGECRPGKQARFAVQDASLGICPVTLAPWCPLPEGGLRIEECYNGEDCWMGACFGASAHGGLDIHHPRGTLLHAPVDIDDHYLYNRVEEGANNNRWQGIHRWPDGSEWILRTCHMIRLTVPEHTPLRAGDVYADGAGVCVGTHDHSHFVFAVREPTGERILLDPWILFRQMILDQAET